MRNKLCVDLRLSIVVGLFLAQTKMCDQNLMLHHNHHNHHNIRLSQLPLVQAQLQTNKYTAKRPRKRPHRQVYNEEEAL